MVLNNNIAAFIRQGARQQGASQAVPMKKWHIWQDSACGHAEVFMDATCVYNYVLHGADLQRMKAWFDSMGVKVLDKRTLEDAVREHGRSQAHR